LGNTDWEEITKQHDEDFVVEVQAKTEDAVNTSWPASMSSELDAVFVAIKEGRESAFGWEDRLRERLKKQKKVVT
jgi:hypothetical protein